MNRKGSYIVEAAVIMPVFVIAMLLVIYIVPIIASMENTSFIAADEMHLEMMKAAKAKSGADLPVRITARRIAEDKVKGTVLVKRLRYRYKEKGIDDLISADYMTSYRKSSFFGLAGNLSGTQNITCRAFTGTFHEPSAGGDTKIVYIFPDHGSKYHNGDCTFLKSNYRLTYMTQSIKKKYHACPLCGAKHIAIGSPVLIFPEYGDAYHLPGCKSVDKYYISTEKSEAENQGYTPCSKCGG
ncbi:MAG: hypothetical protein ACI4LM_02335 [Anaerovoracaceae bacterium]